MKIQLREKFIMNIKTERDVLLLRANSNRVDMCAPPGYHYLKNTMAKSERMSLSALRGSLTIEASLIFPFFLMILLAYFSLLSQYASAAEMKVLAAAEAKKTAVAVGGMTDTDYGDITIHRTKTAEQFWINPFEKDSYITQRAVCRAWIGFTELGVKETYVYITPRGRVYHLSSECTHLDLSIRRVTMTIALLSKNEYGEKYKPCELCEDSFGNLVYITSEGARYHSQRNCSGLKRTIRQVPLSEAEGRHCCIRCTSRRE